MTSGGETDQLRAEVNAAQSALRSTEDALRAATAEAGELRGRLVEMEKALQTYKATERDLRTISTPIFLRMRFLRLLRAQKHRLGFALPLYRRIRGRSNC